MIETYYNKEEKYLTIEGFGRDIIVNTATRDILTLEINKEYLIETIANSLLYCHADKILENLIILQTRLEQLILLTPTGDLRNKLTDESIMALDIINKATNSKANIFRDHLLNVIEKPLEYINKKPYPKF